MLFLSAPQDAYVCYQSGLAYQDLAFAKTAGKTPAAEDQARQADEVADNGTAKTQSMHTQAIARFNKSLSIDANNDEVQLAIAKSYLAEKDYDNVRNIAIKLAGNRDTETEGHYLLGVISYATEDYPQALLSLSKATRADKSNSIA